MLALTCAVIIVYYNDIIKTFLIFKGDFNVFGKIEENPEKRRVSPRRKWQILYT